MKWRNRRYRTLGMWNVWTDRNKLNAALSTVGFSGLGKGKEGFGWAKF